MAHRFPIVRVDHLKLAASSAPPIWGTYTNSGKPLPSVFPNNRHLFPATPLNQGQLGDCSGFGTTLFRAALLQQAGGHYVEFSELAQYWEERNLEGNVNQDSGATVADGIKVLEQFGVQFEDEDPYGVDYALRFKDEPKGPWLKQLALSPDQVKYITKDTNFLNNVLDALAQGLVITIGFDVFADLESAQCANTGILSMPAQGEQSLGGHWVNLFYAEVNDLTKRDGYVWAMNQWGNWGIGGAFKMSLAYAEQYIWDAVVGYPDSVLPQYPQDPGPQSEVQHTYAISAFWDKPQYTVGETGYFGCYIMQDGKPLNTMNLPVYPMVKLSDGEDGMVPTDDTGKGAVPWSTNTPGTYTAVARWQKPDLTWITSQPASCEWNAKAPTPLPAVPSDIDHTQWQQVAEWSLQNGIMFAYNDGTFKPDQSISRGQFAASLFNLNKLLNR